MVRSQDPGLWNDAQCVNLGSANRKLHDRGEVASLYLQVLICKMIAIVIMRIYKAEGYMCLTQKHIALI